MAEAKLSSRPPANAGSGPGSNVLLAVEDLAKDFDVSRPWLNRVIEGAPRQVLKAVDGVSFTINRGETLSLVGESGCGKSTVARLICGLYTPSRGRIAFKGRDITGATPPEIARLGLVRSFQISAVFPHLTALENVRVALQRRRGRSFDFWRPARVLEAFDGRARELLDAVGLAEHEGLPAAELPYGRKRALEIATTLALEPEMMLLDEPTAGMGHEDVGRVSALIKRAARFSGGP